MSISISPAPSLNWARRLTKGKRSLLARVYKEATPQSSSLQYYFGIDLLETRKSHRILVVDSKLNTGGNLEVVRNELRRKYGSRSIHIGVVMTYDECAVVPAGGWKQTNKTGFKLPGDETDSVVYVAYRVESRAQLGRVEEEAHA